MSQLWLAGVASAGMSAGTTCPGQSMEPTGPSAVRDGYRRHGCGEGDRALSHGRRQDHAERHAAPTGFDVRESAAPLVVDFRLLLGSARDRCRPPICVWNTRGEAKLAARRRGGAWHANTAPHVPDEKRRPHDLADAPGGDR